jgi:hypothetical protein
MANKRIRSRRTEAKEELLTGLDLPAPKKQRRLTQRSTDVNREIHRLECIIAAAPHLQKQRQLRRRDTLPPPDEFNGAFRRPAATRRAVPMHARRLQQNQRLLQMAQLAIIILVIAAALGWMKQWFQL